MNYATGYALNTNEIFTNFPTKKMKMTAKECEELIGNRHKEKIAKIIFKACVDMVLDDVIDNNVFHLPTRSRKAELAVQEFKEDKFVECRKRGKFRDVDFLNSDFKGYQMVFNLQSMGVIRQKLVYLDSQHKDRITKNTNNGMRYYGQIC